MSPKKIKNKEPMIACPSCGEQNRIASPFCKSCGDRIYKHGASPTPESTHKEPSSAKKALRSAVNSLLFVACMAVIGLAFWPYNSQRVPTGVDPVQQVKRYLAEVDSALEKGSMLPVASISERNLNAFLGQKNVESESKLLGVILSAPGLELIANEPVGPFHLSTRIVMKPREGSRKPVVTDFWVGHLPLPAFWAKPWTRSMSDRLKLGLDAALWDHLSIEGVQSKSVAVSFQP